MEKGVKKVLLVKGVKMVALDILVIEVILGVMEKRAKKDALEKKDIAEKKGVRVTMARKGQLVIRVVLVK